MKLKSTIGLLILLLILGGCSAWENKYEQAASLSFTVVSIKGPSALSLIKAMEPEIKPTVRLGDAELEQGIIQRSNLQYLDGLGARQVVEKYLNIFLELSPDSIGGKLPNSVHYYYIPV